MSAFQEQLARLYDTIFDRAPDPGGLSYWEGVMAQGLSLGAIAGGFMQAPEFALTYGQPDSASFVRSMYENVLDRPGEAAGVSFWTQALEEGRAGRADLVVLFSESPEHQVQMAQAAAPPVVVAPPQPEPQPPAPEPAAVDLGALDMTALPETKPGPYPTATNPATGELAPKDFYSSVLGKTLVGGADKDAMFALSDPDVTFWGQGGDDLLIGGPGTDALHGGPGTDTLRGGWGDDGLNGGPGDDALDGGDGSDVLYGGDGGDTLVGGLGQDQLYGGAGADVFRYLSADDMGDVPLRDFEAGVDKLDFAALDAVLIGTRPFEADAGTGRPGAGRAQLRYDYDTSIETAMLWKTGPSTVVQVDTDGDGAVDAASLVVGQVLTIGDFILA